MFLQALKEYSPDEAKVLRSSQFGRIHASELVPGDIVSVAVGDKIPADCRLLSVSSSSFRIDQAILTGESTSVHKGVDVVPDLKAVKQDMTNILFSVSHFSTLSFCLPTKCVLGNNRRQWKREGHCRIHWPADSYWRYPQVNNVPNFRKDTFEEET